MLSLSVKSGGVMRELDAEAPVVWPAWCYAAEGASPAESVRRSGGGGGRRRSNLAPSPAAPPPSALTVSPALGLLRPVKNERLSPPALAQRDRDINTPRSDRSRSRSVTPSTASFPGSVSPAGALGERGASPPPPPAYPAGPPPPSHPLPHHLAHPPRNYSDFMRSLAAKYNHNNHIELFQPSRTNGFSTGGSGLAGATAPAPTRPGLSPSSPAPLALTPAAPVPSTPVTGLFAGFSRTQPAFPPVIDMTSTKALMAIARAVGVTAPTPSSSFCERPSKRPHDGAGAAPLDLSAPSPGAKRQRSFSPAPPAASVSPPARACLAPDPAVAKWTVNDVCAFVDTIDICAEYSNNFRHQRIDGAGLPLLTEEHLTGMLQMKLGPALKMKATLAKKLGSCGSCHHCCCKSTSSSSSVTKQERPPSNSSTQSHGHFSD